VASEPPDPATATARPRPSFAETLAVYLQPRVLVVMFLGFSGGLPLALSGSTLQVWATESGVNLRTLGLFAIVGTPYTIKFLWAPFVDALDVPVLSRLLGRRRGWLVLSQLVLIGAIALMSLCDPGVSATVAIVAATFVATASATQDIVIDAFRIESLPEQEQAAGMASYVAAYRVANLVSTAGTLFLVSGFEKGMGFPHSSAWTFGYLVMAGLVVVGIVTSIMATEPRNFASDAGHAGGNRLTRVFETARAALADFLLRDMAMAVLTFVVLFKLTDALAGAMAAPFVIKTGFSRDEYATIIKGLGFAATLLGGFAGGYVARVYPLATSLWIGGILQALANFAFSWQAVVGRDLAWLSFAITVENFTSAIGTVIFVAYLSALCKNPLHTATQFALLTALSAIGRTYLSAGAGYIADATGWVWFFAICAIAGIPGLMLLAWLQKRGHFEGLGLRAGA
jgi:PAT family beta-lactamase induction signal transducer AmpG